jgi:HlyD family secretion protein
MKKFIVILIILILAIGGTYAYFHRHKVNPDEINLYGNIEIRQVDLSFRVEGKIAKMLVEEGDYVKKGQLLGYLEDENYKSTYEKNLADIQAFTANSANALSQYERHIPLCADGTTSKQECDTLKNTKDSSKAELDASKAALLGNKKNYADAKLYAPEDGIIMTRVQEPGAVVEPSQPIYTMAKIKPIWVRVYIPEDKLANIKYGMKANIFTDTINPETGKHRQYTGWVGYISPVAEFTPKTVETTDLRTDLVYRVRVYVYEVDEYLRQGMPVTVKFDLLNKDKRVNSER